MRLLWSGEFAAETPKPRRNPPLAARMAVESRNCCETTGRESSKQNKWLPAHDSNLDFHKSKALTGLAVAADSKFWCLPREFRFPPAERHESRYPRRWDFPTHDWVGTNLSAEGSAGFSDRWRMRTKPAHSRSSFW